jgi:dipeptidyl-peptidase 4
MRSRRSCGVVFCFCLTICLVVAIQAGAQPGSAAAPRVLTVADYQRAEQFMAYNTTPLVFGASVRVNWLAGDRFWYRSTIPEGNEFILVDPAKGTRSGAFNHPRLASALSSATGGKYGAFTLPFSRIDLSADGQSVTVAVEGKRWACDVAGTACKQVGVAAPAPQPGPVGPPAREALLSPDGKLTAFVRNDNLFVRDVATGTERQLTTDGVKDFGYATDNAGWAHSDRSVVLWSPDSKRIATFQQDQRGVGEMYLVETAVGHPKLHAWKYPLPGDHVVTTIQRVIIQVETGKVVRLKMPADQHRSMITDDIKTDSGELADAQWSPDSTSLAFVSTARDHRQEILRVANPETGDVRDVLTETVRTFFESGDGSGNWKYLPASNEVIWFSERDNWGQLYLYDLTSGALKTKITTGEGNVLALLRIDVKARQIYFVGVGREKGRDPYFRHLYRVGFDGAGLTLLTPEDADHDISLSPSGAFFVDAYSTMVVPPVTVLRNTAGEVVVPLETADISKLVAAGWKPPIPFTVKARDGVTDLYGVMCRPSRLDETAKYPIVNYIYPGPQSGSVGSRSFGASRRDMQALAELGFVVVSIDGMGTPYRSKSFHEAYYANMGDNTLPDQIAGMKQLAERYPWIDIDRAGIYGHSGGGYATAAALLRHPDFFKVGVSQAGNHDNREYEDDWGEKWQGLLTKNADGTTSYDDQANETHAKNLKGKLLLAHGTMDDNVPPYNTLLVVNELIKANKDFDLILFPNRTHGFGSEPYMTRRRWDYFVRYLLGAEPPKEYEMKPPAAASPGR